ncbi:rho GTPase-activating protein SYDE2 isoform X2 [Hoplias malabaricus]
MPALQTPTFFPTELEVVDSNVASQLTWDRERHNSVDSEDEDYYDNEILPFYESEGPNLGLTHDSGAPRSVHLTQEMVSAQETDRLRNQLQEAYYLLINTMHDMAFDGQLQSGSSSQSRDSIRSACSRSSTRLAESDTGSSGQHSGQQACGSDWALLDFGESSGARFGGSQCRSLQCLGPVICRRPLQRSVSDSGVHYSIERHEGEMCTVAQSGTTPEPTAVYDTPPVREPEDEVVHHVADTEMETSLSGLVGASDSPELLAQKLGSTTFQSLGQSMFTASMGKPPRVTVNKMQEWMHRGRVLSSEMRQRIAGKPQGQEVQVWPKTLGHPSSATNMTKTFFTTQPGLVSCPHEPCPRSAPLNFITVSKKRNWLHQSCGRPSHQPDDVPASRSAGEDEQPNPPRITVSSPDASCPRFEDPAEENDADDEGEIWYNPIPEDEEADLPHCVPAVQASQLQPRRTSAGAEETRLEEEGKGGAAAAGEVGKANVTYSCDQSHLHRQMCRPDVQENLPTRTAASESPEQSLVGFSPPSSPNPAKKSCSITWSLPDRIKSPRTVRKLSMKMKKLPELSRKLSVKGNPTGSSSVQSEASIHSLRVNRTAEGVATASTSGNVICRYHLDSSVSTQEHSYSKKKGGGDGVPKSASKGGYLSDGDSPELVAKSSKHEGKSSRARDKDKEKDKDVGAPKLELDVDAFRLYIFSEQPKCTAYISGLMGLHFYGAEGLKPPRADSRHVYCAIQVDSVNKARTALLTCRTDFLDMDHAFNIELENAQHLKLALFSWEPAPRRNRVCCHGTVVLPPLFRTSTKVQQLAVRLEPRGTIYVKLGLMEQWKNSLDAPESDRVPSVFGVEAGRVVEREGAGLNVPLIIEKCIAEIERRGCQVVGLYRLCGSAAVKKELREAFERDSHTVDLSESSYPDINVITGVLKDYLRELPSPLISKPLYEAVLDAMSKRPLLIGGGGCENDVSDTEHAVSLLDTLPEVEKMTLRKLLDHLKRVASHHELNKMTCQNLAVCFGPVLLSQRQDASCHSNRVFVDSEELASALHFKKHIEVLHYLLQLWPVVDAQGTPSSPASDPPPSAPSESAPVRRRKERPLVLNLTESELAGVLRPRAGRLDSPSNRYAGDWSDCRETYLQQPCSDEADYDDVPSEEPDPSGHEETTEDPQQDAGEREESAEGAEDAQTEPEKEHESEEEQTEENADLNGLQEDIEEPVLKPWGGPILLDRDKHRPEEHTYQAYMKIQDMSPALSNRVNLRDLQESIDTLIGNLERELNKNKLNVGY